MRLSEPSNTSTNAGPISGTISLVRVARPCFSKARREIVRVRMAAPTEASKGRRVEEMGLICLLEGDIRQGDHIHTIDLRPDPLFITFRPG